MSIRVKLYMSYLAMVFMPFVMIMVFVIILLGTSGMQDLRQYVEVEQEEKLHQAFIYGELYYLLQNDPDKLLSKTYVEGLQQRMEDLWSGLLIAREGEVIIKSPLLEKISPDYNSEQLFDPSIGTLKFHAYRFEKNVYEFQFSDGSAGSSVMIRRSDVVPMYWRPVGAAITFAFIGISSLLLTYYVSRSIINPIRALRTAALQIKEGDLSQKVETTAGGEIGQLSTAFEEMRVRLSQSINQSLQYEENRKMLLSHISHDLKTPISAIKGYVEGIMDGIANTAEKRERYIQTIYQKATGMDQLIDELFLFSKLDLQRVSYDFKTLDLNKYLTHFLEEQRFDLEKADITLQYRENTVKPLYVVADGDKLSRVLLNILQNSVKYMEQQERVTKIITIEALERDRDALVIIEDTGPGVDSADLPYIFDRFYRAEQSRNSETGGSGLGLAIVKQIIEGHGGTVWAENAPHGGAKFFFTLPRPAADETAVNEHEKYSDH